MDDEASDQMVLCLRRLQSRLRTYWCLKPKEKSYEWLNELVEIGFAVTREAIIAPTWMQGWHAEGSYRVALT